MILELRQVLVLVSLVLPTMPVVSPCSHCLLNRAGEARRGSWEGTLEGPWELQAHLLSQLGLQPQQQTRCVPASGLTRWTQTERSFRAFLSGVYTAYRQTWQG